MEHLCPKCKTLLKISASKYVNKDGKIYMVQELTCRNPKCPNDGAVVETIRHELPVETE